MKKLIYLMGFALLLFLSSCKLDSYGGPEETLTGRLVDAQGKGLITEQPNGFKIRIYEEGSTTPLDFWGRADGTFTNTKIFKAKYKIIPIEGAFFPLDTVEKLISGTVRVDFEITPYLYVDASIEAKGKNIEASYKISKSDGAGKIEAARLLVSKWNPNVGMNYNDRETTRSLKNTADDVILATTYTDAIVDYLESGVTYYARVAVLATNPSGRYNFSPVVKITVP